MKKTFLQLLFRYFAKFFIILFPGKFFRKFRNFLWQLQGFEIDSSANLMPDVKILCGNIYIGKNTFIGEEVLITGGEIDIGDNCDIAPRVTIHAGSHEIADFNRRAGKSYYGSIKIGKGVWIGTSSTIIDGAKIGNGVIVAAGSLVLKGDYPDNVLIGGVPAKMIKKID